MQTLVETPYFVARELRQQWTEGDPVVGLSVLHDGSHRHDFGREHPNVLQALRESDGPHLETYLELERDQLARRLMRALIAAIRRRLEHVLIFTVTHKTPRGLIDPNRMVTPDENGVIKAIRPCLVGYEDQDEIQAILDGVKSGQDFFNAMMIQHPDAVGVDLHTMWPRQPEKGVEGRAGELWHYDRRYLDSHGAWRPDCLVAGDAHVHRPHRHLIGGGFVVNEPYGKPEDMKGHGVQCAEWISDFDGRFLAVDLRKDSLGAQRLGTPYFAANPEALWAYADRLAGAVVHQMEVGLHRRLRKQDQRQVA